MEPLNGADAAIGWGLIILLALGCFYGIPFAIQFVVRSIAVQLKRQRAERERIQEELDEDARQNLLRIVTDEHRN